MKKHMYIGILAASFLVGCGQESQTSTETATQPVPQVADVAPYFKTQVYKDPNCGCCEHWIDHIETAGHEVTAHNEENMPSIKEKLGIKPEFMSCHTAVIDGYVFEGHVPVSLMNRFLESPPENALGLAVPGMPLGSPGMEMGDRIQPYDVVLLLKDGSSSVYEHVDTLIAWDKEQE